MRIVLGSQSASRRRLLRQIVDDFDAISPEIDEQAIRCDDYRLLPLLLARAKSDALLQRIDGDTALITSDQVALCNGELREKPRSAEEARAFLSSYAEHSVETVTAVVVHNIATGRRTEGLDTAAVRFRRIPADTVDRIIAQGDVFHTAGGFLIEDPLFAPYIETIEGEMESVMGMPIALTRRLLAAACAE